MDEKIAALINKHVSALGIPCAGTTSDIWSLSSCRESFGCLRGSFVLDGDIVAEAYRGKLVDFSPVLAFSRFEETRHTGAALARWKGAALRTWRLEGAIGLACEDGASNNKKANKILGQEMMVCTPHNIARAVLIACGEAGKPCKNTELKELISRSSKQSASFNRSVIVNKALQEAQMEANPNLKEHMTLTTKAKNLTRWLGLWEMCNRNRRIGTEIRIALTGDGDGVCAETLAPPAAPPARRLAQATRDDSSDESSVNDSDGIADDLEEGARAANKQFPLAHRCLPTSDFRSTDILESLLDRAREITLLCQDERKGFGEGIDLGLNYLLLESARDEALADRVELVSGRGASEAWKEVNANGLAPMFKIFRKEFASQLTTRFNLDTTPSKHVLMALKMNPSTASGIDSPQFAGKTGKYEVMEGEYIRAVRRHAIRVHGLVAQPSPTPHLPWQAVIDAQAAIDAANSPALAEQRLTPRERLQVVAGVAGSPAVITTPAPNTTMPTPIVEAPIKRRKGLLGGIAMQGHTVADVPHDGTSKIDVIVKAEVDKFGIICMQTLAEGLASKYYETNKGADPRFNLRRFWADHKAVLPIHFRVRPWAPRLPLIAFLISFLDCLPQQVFLSEVGCNRAAAANVESVFSGAGKFTEEAKSLGSLLLGRMVKLHYNWKYEFVRPTIEEVTARYKLKFHAGKPDAALSGGAAAAAQI